MTQALDTVIAPAQEDVYKVLDAEALATPVDTGERLSGGFGCIPAGGGGKAVIAVSARFGRFLPKVTKKNLATAECGFAEPQHGFKSLSLQSLSIFVGIGFIQHLSKGDNVLNAKEHECVSWSAVTTGPASFLIIGLNAPGKIEMTHEANVRLIDPHAEGDGRDHDQAFLDSKPPLVILPDLRAQARMIGKGA